MVSFHDRRVEEVELTPSGAAAAEALLATAAIQSGELRRVIPDILAPLPSEFRSGQEV